MVLVYTFQNMDISMMVYLSMIEQQNLSIIITMVNKYIQLILINIIFLLMK